MSAKKITSSKTKPAKSGKPAAATKPAEKLATPIAEDQAFLDELVSIANQLTLKQEKFCLFFDELSNASEAYRKAYDAKNMKPATVNRKAKELLDNGKIRARLKELATQRLVKHQVTIDYVIASLKTVVDRSLQIEPVFTKSGEFSGEYQFNANGANKALELLGKHLVMFTEKVENTVNLKGEVHIFRIPDNNRDGAEHAS